MATTIFMELPDLPGLLQDIQAVDRDLAREVRQAIAQAAEPIVTLAEQYAPHDPTHRGWKGWHSGWASKDPGHIKDSLFIRRTGGATVELRTRHPGGPVHHWGGTIAPSGSPIRIERSEYAIRAGEERIDDVADRVQNAVDHLLTRHNL